MYKVSRLVAGISMIGLLSALAVSARNDEEKAYVDSYQGARPEVPVPLQVVAPVAPSETEGVVKLTFVVTAQGIPTEIAVQASSDDRLNAPSKEAMAQWKFAPAKRNGEAVPCKVVLPFRFVLID